MVDNNNDGDQNNDNDTTSTGDGDQSSGTAVTTALNQQIVQAVDKTNEIVTNAAGPEANGIAYQKVAQATSFAVQDTSDYMRNIMTIAATAQGVCLQLMIANNNPDEYATIMEKAQDAVTAAQKNFEAVGESAAKTLKAFPSS